MTCGTGLFDPAAIAADMHAPSERIRVAPIGAGAFQLRAVLAELPELTPSAAGLS